VNELGDQVEVFAWSSRGKRDRSFGSISNTLAVLPLECKAA
jgi:hypothetical protein